VELALVGAVRARLPAKLSNRRMGWVIDRERLFARLDAEGERPLLWVAGPAGAGKTTLVSTWLERTHLPAAWYRVDAGDGDLATVFSFLAQAARAHSRKRRLQLPALTPEYLADLPGFARRFFGQFFGALPAPAALVFDSVEAAPADALAPLLTWAVAELLPGQRIIVTSRESPSAATLHLLARGEMATLAWADLRLSMPEAKALAVSLLPAAAAESEAERLHAMCDGWAAGFVLMLNLLGRISTLPLHERGALQEQLFPYYLNQLFDGASPATQRLLMHTALLPAFRAADAAAMAPGDDAAATLHSLYRRNFFIERNSDSPPLYRYHALFREFLLQQGESRLGVDFCLELRRKAAGLLQAQGRPEDALGLWLDAQAWEEASAQILALAPAWLAQGRYATLAQAIDTLPELLAHGNPWLAYWRGVAVLPMSQPQARQWLERAFDVFERGGDRIGCLMACSTILESFMLQWDDLKPVDRWGRALRELLAQGSPLPLEVEVRVLSCTTSLMMRGSHLHGDIVRSTLERSLALVPTLGDPQLRLSLATNCGFVLNYLGRWPVGQRLIAEVEAQLRWEDLEPLPRILFGVIKVANALWTGHFAEAFAEASQTREFGREWNIRVFDVVLTGIRAVALVHLDDIEAAEAARQSMFVAPGRRLDESHLLHIDGLLLLVRGQLPAARDRLERSFAISAECGCETLASMVRLLMAQALALSGSHEGALRQLQAVTEIATAAQLALLEQAAMTLRAWVLGRRGDTVAAAEVLRAALAMGREHGFRLVFPYALDVVMQEIGVMAARAGIEPDYMRELLQVRRVPPPGPDADAWPWPVRVSLLGGFDLRLGEQPIRLPAKAPKKPLELLKLLAATAGSGLPLAAACRWPPWSSTCGPTSMERRHAMRATWRCTGCAGCSTTSRPCCCTKAT
jgi:LuxR family maltose regulon positive regulatory protein